MLSTFNLVKQQLTKLQTPLVTFYHQLCVKLGCCLLCQQQCHSQTGLCDHCDSTLPRFKLEQLKGDMLNWPAIYQGLPNIHFDQLISFSPYIWPVNQWVVALKYQQRFDLAKLLAYLLAQQISALKTQFNPQNSLMTCVPISPNRWQQRGYNQAHLIAQALAKQLALPYNAEVFVKHHEYGSQVGLTGKQRRSRLKSSFSCQDTNLPEQLLIVDDVVTTGATASCLAELAKQHHCSKVTIVSVALTLSET